MHMAEEIKLTSHAVFHMSQCESHSRGLTNQLLGALCGLNVGNEKSGKTWPTANGCVDGTQLAKNVGREKTRGSLLVEFSLLSRNLRRTNLNVMRSNIGVQQHG